MGTRGGEVAGSEAIMSLIQSCKDGDLEGVKAALQRGDDVNTKDEDGWTGLMFAVSRNHNSVAALLLKKPNIDVNLKSESGFCALHCAVFSQNNEGLKLLLNVPNIDVNIVENHVLGALRLAFVNMHSHQTATGRLDDPGWTGLMWAVSRSHNSMVALLLNTPNIDVNLKTKSGLCALHCAVHSENNEGLKLLLNVPNIDVNIVENNGWSALYMFFRRGKGFGVKCRNIETLKLLLNVPTIDVNAVDNRGENAVHWALTGDSFEGLKLLLSHPYLTALTLNQKGKHSGCTPAMQAVKWNTLEYLEVLVADPRVDLDTTEVSEERKSLERVARDRGEGREKVVAKAKERRRLKRLIREQQRQVSKVLLDGLYDPDSPFSKLNGVRTEVVGEIIWQKLVENWQIFPEDLLSSVLLSARKIICKVQ